MVTFRCKRSGNCVKFANPNDIEQMRKHEGYVEVKEAEELAIPDFIKPVEQPAPVKRMGRPRKVV